MLFAFLVVPLLLQAPADATTREVQRRPVTPRDLETAFEDSSARSLFERARRSRLAQDSSIANYDAKVRLRLSVTAGIGGIGRERLVYRSESASRVQWQRGAGAHIEMTGARISIPVVDSPKEERDALRKAVTDADLSPIPYFPGSETIWIGGRMAKADVDERRIVTRSPTAPRPTTPIARETERHSGCRMDIPSSSAS